MEIKHYTEAPPESLTKIVEGWAKKHSPSFDDLSAYVLQTHQTTQAGAIRAINQMATLRRITLSNKCDGIAQIVFFNSSDAVGRIRRKQQFSNSSDAVG